MELEMNPPRISTSRLTRARLLILTLVAATVLIFSFSVLIVSTLLGLQLGDALLRPNPFAAYESIWPGQPITRLASYARGTPEGEILCATGAAHTEEYPGLIMEVSYSSDASSKHRIVCSASFDTGAFRSMTVKVENGKIYELTLFAADLHQDSLFLYWGAPDAITSIQGTTRLYLHWNRDAYEGTAAVLEADYMVDFVTLARIPPPD